MTFMKLRLSAEVLFWFIIHTLVSLLGGGQDDFHHKFTILKSFIIVLITPPFIGFYGAISPIN